MWNNTRAWGDCSNRDGSNGSPITCGNGLQFADKVDCVYTVDGSIERDYPVHFCGRRKSVIARSCYKLCRRGMYIIKMDEL